MNDFEKNWALAKSATIFITFTRNIFIMSRSNVKFVFNFFKKVYKFCMFVEFAWIGILDMPAQ